MTSQGDLHFFSEAKNPIIFGGTFTGNVTNYSPKLERYGLRILLENIAKGAFHNAAERGDPPRCHLHTRKAIRAEIMEWIKVPSSMRKLILWMYGPAGSGKTAIAQSIAEECESEGLLAASFFFSRTAAGRNDATRFIATLVYQLSRSIPEIAHHIFVAIEQDPTIFSRSLPTQMRVLVVEPLKTVPSLLRTVFLIVDGIDECGPNHQSQVDVLNILASAMSELQHIPLIILLASRPEYEIREAFLRNPLSTIVKRLVLDDNYRPNEDIKLFFNSKFQEICDKHLRLGSYLPSPWPAENDVNLLVSKASGQFIFAATVTKFIDSPRHSPVARLDMIMGLSSAGNETPFALLDALYRHILASVSNVRNVLDVLTLLLLADTFSSDLTVDLAEELLGFDVRRALVDMHALVFVPPPGGDKPRKRGNGIAMVAKSVLRIHHASLYDFFMDQSRSLGYHIDASRGHASLSRSWLKVISIRPHSRNSQYTYLSLPIKAFIYHFRRSCGSPTKEITDDLARLSLRAGLEGISNLNLDLYGPDWITFFECVKELGGDRDDIFPRLQKDFDTFILDSIAQYPLPLQTFIPILLQNNFHGDILGALIHTFSQSAEESRNFRYLDENLLGADKSPFRGEGQKYIMDFLRDKSRAGRHAVDGEAYTALAKATVSVMCPTPGEWSSDPKLRIGLIDKNLSWFPDILEGASIDLDLANFLLERTIQFDSRDPWRNPWVPGNMSGRITIAHASMKYIQRCGIPFLEHTHQPHITECIICSVFYGASVKKISSLSIFGGDVSDFLPEAEDVFDVTIPPLNLNDTDHMSDIPNGFSTHILPGSEPSLGAIPDSDPITYSTFSWFGLVTCENPLYLILSPSSYIDIFL